MSPCALQLAALVWVFAPLHLHDHHMTDDGVEGAVCVSCPIAQNQSAGMPNAALQMPLAAEAESLVEAMCPQVLALRQSLGLESRGPPGMS